MRREAAALAAHWLPPRNITPVLIWRGGRACQALNEQLSRAEHDRERYKVGYDELTAKLKKQEADRNDQAEYLKHELEKTKQEVAALEEKYLALETSKESMERRLNAQLAEAQEKIRSREGELRDASTENERLNGLLSELGQLRTNAAADSTGGG